MIKQITNKGNNKEDEAEEDEVKAEQTKRNNNRLSQEDIILSMLVFHKLN